MFEILEHPADIGFRARAGSLRELFEYAAEALVAIALEIDGIEQREAYPIQAEGESNESLLVNWLSEVLYYLDGRQLVMRSFRVRDLSPTRVSGDALGEPWRQSHHQARLVVKGVTYHQLKVEQTEQGWFCEVYLDV
jgi:SHS2 domain-containing protein